MPAEFMPAIPLLLGRGAPTLSGNFPPCEALSLGSQQAFGSSKSLSASGRGVLLSLALETRGRGNPSLCVPRTWDSRS